MRNIFATLISGIILASPFFNLWKILIDYLSRELAEDGYSGVEVRVTPVKTEIIIMATRTQSVLGEKGRR